MLSARDLHIFEVGPDIENIFVAVRPTPATTRLNPLMDANCDGRTFRRWLQQGFVASP
jgi:hypothetical protein